MQFDLGVFVQELLNGPGLMGRKVIKDDVHFLPRPALGDDFAQERHELLASVAGCGFAMHAPGAGVQGCLRGEGAVPVIFKAMALGAAGREGQNGGPGGPALEWPIFHPRKKRRRAEADSSKDR